MAEIREETLGAVTVLGILGELDLGARDRMLAKIDDLMSRDRIRIVLDASRLTLLDSAGVGTVVVLFKRARQRGGDVKISALGAQPLEMFKLLRLERAFDLHATIATAVAALAATAPRT